jgi:hypothetical protein
VPFSVRAKPVLRSLRAFVDLRPSETLELTVWLDPLEPMREPQREEFGTGPMLLYGMVFDAAGGRALPECTGAAEHAGRRPGLPAASARLVASTVLPDTIRVGLRPLQPTRHPGLWRHLLAREHHERNRAGTFAFTIIGRTDSIVRTATGRLTVTK